MWEFNEIGKSIVGLRNRKDLQIKNIMSERKHVIRLRKCAASRNVLAM